jgi:hypothetical protein
MPLPLLAGLPEQIPTATLVACKLVPLHRMQFFIPRKLYQQNCAAEEEQGESQPAVSASIYQGLKLKHTHYQPGLERSP